MGDGSSTAEDAGSPSTDERSVSRFAAGEVKRRELGDRRDDAVPQIGRRRARGRFTGADRSRLADEDLLESVTSGDEGSLEVLYDRHGKAAWSLAFRLLSDRESAEDLVQEAFVALWDGANRYTPAKGSVRTWLLSIVHHGAVDRLRQTAASRRRQDALEQVGRVAPDGPDVADVALARAAAREVRTALSGVPHDQLQVLRLAYYGGYTHVEIAGMLALPLGTVKSRMRLGLERVRRNIEPEMIALPNADGVLSPRGQGS